MTTARLFHETYERLAPSFGYETRKDTKAFDPDSPNGRLMTAVCAEIENSIRRTAFLEAAEIAELTKTARTRFDDPAYIDGWNEAAGAIAAKMRERAEKGAEK